MTFTQIGMICSLQSLPSPSPFHNMYATPEEEKADAVWVKNILGEERNNSRERETDLCRLNLLFKKKYPQQMGILKEDEESVLKHKINIFKKIRKTIKSFFLDTVCVWLYVWVCVCVMYMSICSPRKLFTRWLQKSCHCCFNILGSKKDSIHTLGKLTTTLPDILRNLLSPHTHTKSLPKHAFCKALSVRALFWKTRWRPQANNWLHTPLHQALSPFLNRAFNPKLKLTVFRLPNWERNRWVWRGSTEIFIWRKRGEKTMPKFGTFQDGVKEGL